MKRGAFLTVHAATLVVLLGWSFAAAEKMQNSGFLTDYSLLKPVAGHTAECQAGRSPGREPGFFGACSSSVAARQCAQTAGSG